MKSPAQAEGRPDAAACVPGRVPGLPCPAGKAISPENGQKTKDRNNMDPNSFILLVVIILALVVGAFIGARLRRK